MTRREPFVLWFTGMPCSGKTTLALAVGERLLAEGFVVRQLDGDEVRRRYSVPLGFSAEDRMTHVKRVTELAASFQKAGESSIVSLVSPFRNMREWAKNHLSGFVEIYLRCPLSVCEARDVKGMYRLARQGGLDRFTGVSDPYEEPLNPAVQLDTDRLSVEECTESIMRYLEVPSRPTKPILTIQKALQEISPLRMTAMATKATHTRR